VPPIYQPEVAARGVVYAADHPRRKQYWVGASTAATILANKVAPALLDRYLARTAYGSQQTAQAAEPGQPDNLMQPVDGIRGHDHGSRGVFGDRSHERSAQLWLSQHVRAVLRAAGRRGGRRGCLPGRKAGTAPVMARATGGPALLQLTRASYGVALVMAPGPVIRLATGRFPGRRARRVAQLLGARHLVQAALTAVSPRPAVFALGAEVDVAHAASMLMLAAAYSAARRTALTDALAESLFAAAGCLLLSARRGKHPRAVVA
jgi:hypothetical protein